MAVALVGLSSPVPMGSVTIAARLHAASLKVSSFVAGNRDLIKRITRAAPLKSLRITWAFISKAYARSSSAARELFFSDDLPLEDLDRCAHFTCAPGSLHAVAWDDPRSRGLIGVKLLAEAAKPLQGSCETSQRQEQDACEA